jgi:hypothetical protein
MILGKAHVSAAALSKQTGLHQELYSVCLVCGLQIRSTVYDLLIDVVSK